MGNKVYYGEYSLKHWINLMLTKNIILPDYQRLFVWTEEKVEKLIQTFQEKEFVPPVTIGAFKVNGTNNNLIIDGQQRLTSILLAYLGLFPDKTTFKAKIERNVDENDDDVNEDENDDNILEWKFNELLKKGSNKNEINGNTKDDDHYKKFNFTVDENFLETNYLGFCYLVPDVPDEKQQQKYYSSIFRNINIQGEPLSPQESRDALYYLDMPLVPFFKPEFIKTFTVIIQGRKSNIDFTRYLSLLSQYYKDKEARKIARSYKPKMEKYYEEYIDSVINDKNEKYDKFSEIFQNRDFVRPYSKLKETIELIDIPKIFYSIIDLDMYFFGLIYTMVFEKKQIDVTRKEELKEEIKSKIQEYKNDLKHTKSPSNLGHLRERISSSIDIYSKYES